MRFPPYVRGVEGDSGQIGSAQYLIKREFVPPQREDCIIGGVGRTKGPLVLLSSRRMHICKGKSLSDCMNLEKILAFMETRA